MVKQIVFESFFGQPSRPVASAKLFTAIIEDSSIILVYQNGVYERFPATDYNIGLTQEILETLGNPVL